MSSHQRSTGLSLMSSHQRVSDVLPSFHIYVLLPSHVLIFLCAVILPWQLDTNRDGEITKEEWAAEYGNTTDSLSKFDR